MTHNARVVELRIPGDKVLLLREGQIDTAAVLAFLGGHCHSLALALNTHTGWPLVAVDNGAGECAHVGVRRPDGQIVDITGAHAAVEISGAVNGGGVIRSITADWLDRLYEKHGWAAPTQDIAALWVAPALSRMSRQPLPAMTTPTMRLTRETASGVEVEVLWSGEPEFVINVRFAGTLQSPWARYGRVRFPKDADGLWRLSFYVEQFQTLAEQWLEYGFDESRARATLLDG